jgi:hypothetical protein
VKVSGTTHVTAYMATDPVLYTQLYFRVIVDGVDAGQFNILCTFLSSISYL